MQGRSSSFLASLWGLQKRWDEKGCLYLYGMWYDRIRKVVECKEKESPLCFLLSIVGARSCQLEIFFGRNTVMQMYVVLSCKEHGGKKIYACRLQKYVVWRSLADVRQSYEYHAGNPPPPMFLSCFGVYIVNFSMVAAVWQSQMVKCRTSLKVSQIIHWIFFWNPKGFLATEVSQKYVEKCAYKSSYVQSACTASPCMPLICPCRKTSPQRYFHFQLVH